MNNIICEIMELYAKYLSIFTSFYVSPALFEALDYTNSFKLTLEGIGLKKLHEGIRGRGGVNRTPPFHFWHHSSDWFDIWHI